MALEPPLNDPDWGRYHVDAGKAAAVGDPMRWGATTTTRISGIAGNPITSGQLIAAATRDAYARPWSVLGTITLPLAVWELVGGAPWSVGAVPAGMRVVLECIMGVGQIQITHHIVLRNSTTEGLLNQQSVLFAPPGPYAPIQFETPPGDTPAELLMQPISRNFAIIGGLLGQSINARIIYYSGAGNGFVPFDAKASLIVTPYATGEGL